MITIRYTAEAVTGIELAGGATLRREGETLLVAGATEATLAEWCGVTVAELPAYLEARYAEAWREAAEHYCCVAPF